MEEEIALTPIQPDTSRKVLFSSDNPNLQVIWDASTINDLSECPFLYKLKHIDGWTPKNSKVDLIFGSAVGLGLEVFIKEIVEEGKTHDEALCEALREALQYTWDDIVGEGDPLLGGYFEQWRCMGTTKYKNSKGNAAKCPWSHKGKWFMAPGPATCGTCGSHTETKWRWLADTPQKDRMQVLRTIVWYTEQIRGGILRPVSLTAADGTHEAMVEVNWCVPFAKILGTQFYLTGNWDSIKQLASSKDEQPTAIHPTDYKTTKFPLTDDHYRSYWPGWQFEIYDMVAEVVLPEGLRELYGGVMIEAMQVGTGWVRFGNRIFQGDPASRNETFRNVHYQMMKAKTFADENYWPQEKSACWRCPFQEVCGSPPHRRDHILRENFTKSFWNPLTRRREAEGEQG